MNILFKSVEIDSLVLNSDGTYSVEIINLDKKELLDIINEFEGNE